MTWMAYIVIRVDEWFFLDLNKGVTWERRSDWKSRYDDDMFLVHVQFD